MAKPTTGRKRQGKSRGRSPVACLNVLASPDREAIGRIHLLGMATYVGSEPAEPELVWIADPRLEVRHCRILRAWDTFTVEDLGSSRGSFIEGRRIEQQQLRFGELLRCGDTLLLMGELDLTAVRWVHARASGLVGGSRALVQALIEVAQLARLSVPVLLSGEPGSGRQRLAWEMHRQSGRGGPFLPYDCATVPAGQHLGDLLGRRPPAAPCTEPGLVAMAGRGTLFLGNVEALHPAAAEQLPMMLQGGRRPGRRRPALLDGGPRLVLSANDPAAPLSLHGVEQMISLPPLRERREDILPLLQLFLRSSKLRRRRKARAELHPDLLEALLLDPWSGNADRLRRVAEQLLLLGGQAPRYTVELAERLGISRAGCQPGISPAAGAVRQPGAEAALPPPPPRGESPSPEELCRLLAAFQGQIRRMARYLGRDRRLVYRWLERAGLLEGRR